MKTQDILIITVLTIIALYPNTAFADISKSVINVNDTIYEITFNTEHSSVGTISSNLHSYIHNSLDMNVTSDKQYNGSLTLTLAKYAAITGIYGQIYYGTSTKTILTPYNSGWFNVVTMQNGSTQNESISGIDPSNDFSITWLSSTGT